jgi:hypothetical protein
VNGAQTHNQTVATAAFVCGWNNSNNIISAPPQFRAKTTSAYQAASRKPSLVLAAIIKAEERRALIHFTHLCSLFRGRRFLPQSNLQRRQSIHRSISATGIYRVHNIKDTVSRLARAGHSLSITKSSTCGLQPPPINAAHFTGKKSIIIKKRFSSSEDSFN